jgi:hypothetical protein
MNYGHDDKKNIFEIPKDDRSAQQNLSAAAIDLEDIDAHPFASDE